MQLRCRIGAGYLTRAGHSGPMRLGAPPPRSISATAGSIEAATGRHGAAVGRPTWPARPVRFLHTVESTTVDIGAHLPFCSRRLRLRASLFDALSNGVEFSTRVIGGMRVLCIRAKQRQNRFPATPPLHRMSMSGGNWQAGRPAQAAGGHKQRAANGRRAGKWRAAGGTKPAECASAEKVVAKSSSSVRAMTRGEPDRAGATWRFARQVRSPAPCNAHSSPFREYTRPHFCHDFSAARTLGGVLATARRHGTHSAAFWLARFPARIVPGWAR